MMRGQASRQKSPSQRSFMDPEGRHPHCTRLLCFFDTPSPSFPFSSAGYTVQARASARKLCGAHENTCLSVACAAQD